MKKSCLHFDKKIQMCILHSPLQRSYLKKSVKIYRKQCKSTVDLDIAECWGRVQGVVHKVGHQGSKPPVVGRVLQQKVEQSHFISLQ